MVSAAHSAALHGPCFEEDYRYIRPAFESGPSSRLFAALLARARAIHHLRRRSKHSRGARPQRWGEIASRWDDAKKSATAKSLAGHCENRGRTTGSAPRERICHRPVSVHGTTRLSPTFAFGLRRVPIALPPLQSFATNFLNSGLNRTGISPTSGFWIALLFGPVIRHVAPGHHYIATLPPCSKVTTYIFPRYV